MAYLIPSTNVARVGPKNRAGSGRYFASKRVTTTIYNDVDREAEAPRESLSVSRFAALASAAISPWVIAFRCPRIEQARHLRFQASRRSMHFAGWLDRPRGSFRSDTSNFESMTAITSDASINFTHRLS